MREALGVEAGDIVRYVISEKGVQVIRTHWVRELEGMLAREGQAPASLDVMETAIAEGAIESRK